MLKKRKIMLTLQMSPKDLDTANINKKDYPVSKIRIRMLALTMTSCGATRNEVSKFLGVSTKSVKRYIEIYNESGLEGIRQLHYRGPHSAIDSYSSSIENSFKKCPPRTAKEAASRIKELTGVEISASRAGAFMKRIGMRCLKMGHIPAKADTERQKTFYEETLKPLIEGSKNETLHLFYMDAAHFVLSPFVCVVWCFARVFIKAASGRNRINVLGAIHAKTHQLQSIINTTYITSTEVVELMEKLATNFVGKPIHIVLDNARYQHCEFVKQNAERLKIHLVFLPPYSPNLNIIERFWKYLREKTLHGKYYDTVNVFHAAIRKGIDCVNSDSSWKQEIASRLSENIQFFDTANVLP